MLHLALIAVHDPQRIGRDHGQFVIGQINNPLRVPHQRRGIAGDKMFVIAHAHDQRAAQPGGE